MQVSKYSLVTQLAYCIFQNNRTGARRADMKWSKIKVLKALIVWCTWGFLFVEKHVHFEGTQFKGYCNLNKNR